MALDINLRETQGITLLRLKGRLVFGQECDCLHEQVKQLLALGKKNLVLNLEKVSHTDSAGLGCLAGIFTSIRTQGGKLKFVKPSEKVQEALALTRLSTVFELYPSEDEALASSTKQ